MKTKKQLTEYVECLLQKEPSSVLESAVNTPLLLLHVYMCGIEDKEFPVDKLTGIGMNDVPEPYHTTLGKILAIKGRLIDGQVKEHFMREVIKDLKEFKRYFSRQPKEKMNKIEEGIGRGRLY